MSAEKGAPRTIYWHKRLDVILGFWSLYIVGLPTVNNNCSIPRRTQIMRGIICRFRVLQICEHRCVVRTFLHTPSLETCEGYYKFLELMFQRSTFLLTSHENFTKTSAHCGAVPAPISELILTLFGAERNALWYFFQEGRLFLTYVGESTAQPTRLLADERRVHHHVTAHGPV